MVMRFPAKKRWHSLPPSGCLGTPLPLPESVRTDGRTDVRTDGHVTITSQPKFLGLIGYQISLAMELRWRALPAGSAINGKKKFKRILVEGEKFKLQKLHSKDFIALFSSRRRVCPVLKHNRVSEVFKRTKVHDFEYYDERNYVLKCKFDLCH